MNPAVRAGGGPDHATVHNNPGLAEGVNVHQGKITYRAVAESQGRKYMPLDALV